MVCSCGPVWTTTAIPEPYVRKSGRGTSEPVGSGEDSRPSTAGSLRWLAGRHGRSCGASSRIARLRFEHRRLAIGIGTTTYGGYLSEVDTQFLRFYVITDTPEMRTCACAPQCVELLAECEILEDQFAMSAADQRQRPDQLEIISSTRRFCRSTCGESTVARPVLILANDRVPAHQHTQPHGSSRPGYRRKQTGFGEGQPVQLLAWAPRGANAVSRTNKRARTATTPSTARDSQAPAYVPETSTMRPKATGPMIEPPMETVLPRAEAVPAEC